MKLHYAWIVALLPVLTVMAGEPKSVRNANVEMLARSALPSSLREIVPGKTSEKDVLAKLGAPKKRSDDAKALYYHLSHRDYDTTIELKNGKVLYFLYEIPSDATSPALRSFRPVISDELLRSSTLEAAKGRPAREFGEILTATLPAQGLELEFDAKGSQRLRSLLVWEAGKEHP